MPVPASARATSTLPTNSGPEKRGRAISSGMATIPARFRQAGIHLPTTAKSTAGVAVLHRSLAHRLLTDRIERAQFRAAHHDHLRPQSTVPTDPGTDRRRGKPPGQPPALVGWSERNRAVAVIRP